MIKVKGKYNTAKIFNNNVEETAFNQILELCNQKAFEGAKIRIMPDTHAGKGCVIGFTAELNDKVIPNLVGVDIGCGMETTELGNIEIDFEALDFHIRRNIPHGHKIHSKASGREMNVGEDLMNGIEDISNKTETNFTKHLRSLGSLGGGNHFIEINVDSNNNKYLVIHSGSRNLGLQVAKHHQKKAEEYCSNKAKEINHEMNREIGLLRQQGKTEGIQQLIENYNERLEEIKVPKDLMYLEGKEADEYLSDMYVAQEFALLSRKHMSESIANFLGLNYGELEKFTTVHNYINPKDKVIRKGAIRANNGEKVIIPINMRDGSIIAIGKGNEDWNNSAPHGAGRILSRTKAKSTLALEDFQDTMTDVWTSSVNESTLDESPMAYKPIEEILNNVGDALDVIEVIKPLYNFKAN